MSDCFKSSADRIIIAISVLAAIVLYCYWVGWHLPTNWEDTNHLAGWAFLSYLAHRVITWGAVVLFIVAFALSKKDDKDEGEIDYYNNYNKA